MAKSITTSVLVLSVNHVEEDEAQRIAEENGYDDIGEYAESLESSVEGLIAHRLFGDADEIPLIDVSTEVYDEMGDEEIDDIREELK